MRPISNRQSELEALHHEIFGDAEEVKPQATKPAEPLTVDDSELLEIAFRSAKGEAIRPLWDGHIPHVNGKSDHSAADQALANHLVYWCQGDLTRADRLFRQSGLYRPKWDERRGKGTYGQMTLEKAQKTMFGYYDPAYRSNGKNNGNGHHAPSEEPPPFDDLPVVDPFTGETVHFGAVPSISLAPTVTASGGSNEPPTGEVFNLTDLGNARRMVAWHGQDLRYVHSWGKWIIWDGTRWEIDETNEVERRAKQTIAGIYAEAASSADDDRRKTLAKWAIQSESLQRIRAMIALAQSEAGIPIRHDRLDNQPMLLNCLNGTLDLRTGQLRKHKREDLLTKRIEVNYDPSAECPRWLKFLDRVMSGNQEMIRFLQRAEGYTLTGDVGEQCVFFMLGTGRNGKSTYIETRLALLGEYGQKAPTEMLMMKNNGGGIPNDLARLPGARLVVAAEVEQGRRLAESTVKDLTGGDTITARFLRQEFFDFIPTHKIWMYGNHKPVIKGSDEGIWRRIHLIPFEVQIPENEQDPGLKRKLAEELPGILAWAVRGCLDWQQSGLGVPESVKAATAGYRAEMDVISAFVEECCTTDKNHYAKFGELYKVYTEWCNTSGERAESKRRFGDSLTERGYKAASGTGNVAIRWGLGIKAIETEKDS